MEKCCSDVVRDFIIVKVDEDHSQCVTKLLIDVCGRVGIWPICRPEVEVDSRGRAVIEGDG